MGTILVTGGAGYTGARLVDCLLREGKLVVCVDNLKFGGESLLNVWGDPGFSFHNCDITDLDSLDRILRMHDYDAVVHLAAIVGDPACKAEPELATRTNWDTSKFLVDRCVDLKIPRMVFAATCSNYGKMPDPEGFVDENSPLAPVSLYARLKVKVEDYILNEIPKSPDFCPTSLRFATVHGLAPRMRFDLTVNEFTKELALGRELVAFGEQFWRPYCHVNDYARAVSMVLSAPTQDVAYDVFNVGTDSENYTKGMIIGELQKVYPAARIKRVVKDEDPRDYRVTFRKIAERLGFNTTKTVPDSIREVGEAIASGVIADTERQEYYNIPH